MTTILDQRPVEVPPVLHGRGNGGAPARRAVARWALRLFRREWRQQVLVLLLLALAAAGTTLGLALADNSLAPGYTRFTIMAPGQSLTADLDAFRKQFGAVDII